ncbi:MAG: PepSY domain-containing protein [Rhodobacterales bacterium]
MLRQFHKLPGLFAALLVAVLAISGTILSIMPAVDQVGVAAPAKADQTVSEMIGLIAAHYPGVDHIMRKPSGQLVVYYFKGDTPGADIVDPATGAKIANFAPTGFEHWMTTLHRSLLFENDNARLATGLGALAMLILSWSGLSLTARRMGGWRNLFGRVRGTRIQRLHVSVGRVAVLGFIFSALTAIYLSLTTFGVIANDKYAAPDFPRDVNGGPALSVTDIGAFKTILSGDLRKFSFPYPGDLTDVYSITTSQGSGFVDQATGKMLSYLPNSRARRIYEFIYMLHTGKGLWWLGLLLGVCALAIPFMAVSGTMAWWRARRTAPKIRNNVSAKHAQTVILVGSEGNSTWGFAKTLHDTLTAKGHRVHTAPMNRFGLRYHNAERMFILTATYGDGQAPASAKGFLGRLAGLEQPPEYPVAVLGFGDRQFPKFCKYAADVASALAQKGCKTLMPLDFIDRQSTQEFARWGRAVGQVPDMAECDLFHVPTRPKTRNLTLLSRTDYGAEVQAPTTILRFGGGQTAKTGLMAKVFRRGLPSFEAGDLVGILPPGCVLPRYYSLASSKRDGMLEICVRKQAGGLCSEFLHNLQVGDQIEAFIKPNPDFRPAKGRAPVILVGAGTGVGPLAGFARGNRGRKPMHLYFGNRHPASDFLYQKEIEGWLEDQHLKSATFAFSRIENKTYVQDQLLADADNLRLLIAQGAQIMVCGGRDMAQSVMAALEQVLAPTDLTPILLKAEGRYVEDVY